MTTSERLEGYYPFSPEVIDVVSEFAECQRHYSSYGDFFASLGIDETQKLQYDGYLPVEIVDIRPAEHDPEEAMIVHLAMANPLDPNQLYQVATIAGTNPDTRVVAVGNPSGGGITLGA
jgi:hypothetical protein